MFRRKAFFQSTLIMTLIGTLIETLIFFRLFREFRVQINIPKIPKSVVNRDNLTLRLATLIIR